MSLATVVESKRCNGCDKVKPLDAFSKQSRAKDGRQRRCKECARKCNHEYRQQNADRRREKQREYYLQNAERKREYYLQNAERKSEYYREYSREYRQQNADLAREQARKYRRTPKGRVVTNARSRRRRARKRSLPAEVYTKRDIALRDQVIYGDEFPACWMCGHEVSEYDQDEVEHLIPISAEAGDLAVWGVSNPGDVLANVAFSCPPCNNRKHANLLPCAIARYLRNLREQRDKVRLIG